MGYWPKNGLLDMNKGLSLQYTGRPHSGIDDCKNIANIMKTLACQASSSSRRQSRSDRPRMGWGRTG